MRASAVAGERQRRRDRAQLRAPAPELHAGTALCAVVKADGYGHGAVQSARAALAGGAELAGGRRRARGARAARGGPARGARARDGPAQPAGACARRSRPAPSGRVARGLPAGRSRRPAADGARQARLGHGPARHARPGRGLARGRGGGADARRRARGRDDALRHRRRARGRRLLRRPAERVHALGARRSRRAPGDRRPRGQQRRDDARRRGAVRHGRCGIAIYGMDPFGRDPAARALEPALELQLLRGRGRSCARRARAPAMDGSSWPSRTPTSACCRSATATAGGAALSNNADVLIGGRRYPLVGTVSMDSITVDLGRTGIRSSCAVSARS